MATEKAPLYSVFAFPFLRIARDNTCTLSMAMMRTGSVKAQPSNKKNAWVGSIFGSPNPKEIITAVYP